MRLRSVGQTALPHNGGLSCLLSACRNVSTRQFGTCDVDSDRGHPAALSVRYTLARLIAWFSTVWAIVLLELRNVQTASIAARPLVIPFASRAARA